MMDSQKHLRTYRFSDAAVFHRTREKFGGLSNMATGFPLHIHGLTVPTSEALYQACRFPSLPDVQREILTQPSPMTAKMKSRRFRSQSREDWLQVRHKVMRWCLQLKLAQNMSTFAPLLMSTGDLAIVELSRKDPFWGAMLQADGQTLVGQNVLGRLLMELRERLRVAAPEDLNVIRPPSIPDFLLLGSPIGVLTGARPGSDRQPQQPLI
jgi:ribA/ribD-fused uncharacterized protein